MHAFQAVNLHEHLLRIDETVRFANEKTEKARIEVSAATEKLVEKRKEEEILKTLRKRRFDAWTRDYYRDEGKTLDDIATVKYLKDRKEQ
jgi:flagellar export protein FliJ